MDRRRAHEAFLDGRMYAIHGEESVLENPIHFGSQFRGLRTGFKLFATSALSQSDFSDHNSCSGFLFETQNKATIGRSIPYSTLH